MKAIRVLPRAKRLIQFHGDLKITGGFNTFDVIENQAAARSELAPPLKRCQDVGRRHGLTVVKLNTLAQGNHDGFAVGGHRFARCEQRYRRVGAIEGIETLKHVVRDGGRQIRGNHLLIKAWEVRQR